jgi:hypothetical protein
MKQEVQRAMCRGGQWDGRTVSAKFYAQPSFFRYLKDEFEAAYCDEIPKQAIRFTRSRKVIFDNLAASRRRVKYQGELIRILCEDELDAVRKVLGVSFGVGVMQPVPSLKALKVNPSISGTVWLRNNDPVRIVTCCPEGADIENGSAKPVYLNSLSQFKSRPMKMMCSYRGVDFRFNSVKYGVSEISVQCRFVKVRGDSILLKKCFGRIAGECDSSGSDSDSSCMMVSEGDYITLQSERVYVVREVREDGTVRCVSPANPINEPIVLSIEEANEALSRQCK